MSVVSSIVLGPSSRSPATASPSSPAPKGAGHDRSANADLALEAGVKGSGLLRRT